MHVYTETDDIETEKNEMKSYCIMHLERHVATIRRDGSCTVYYPSFMPYSLYLETAESAELEKRLENLNNFYYWCSSRILTLDRRYAKEILNSLGMKQAVTDRDRAEIAIGYHCLSLTDVYWVRELRESVRYRDIELYHNSLSNAFVDVALKGRYLTAENTELLKKEDSAGDIATAGVSPKAWVRKDGSFWLYKDGSKAEVRAELLASRIVRCFSVASVEYVPREYDGEITSASRLITDMEQSIVTAEFMSIYAANHDIDLKKIILKQDAYGFYMMNIIDYLVGNTDRHWGNWGFLIDNRTNRFGKLHPLMDFNRAFTAYDTEDGAHCQTVPGMISQKDAAVAAVREIGLNQKAEVQEAWFADAGTYRMFAHRLEILKCAENERV